MTMLIPIRDENPYKRFPVLTLLIIGINVYVFLAFGVSQESVLRLGAIPCDVMDRCEAASRQLRGLFPGRSALASLFTSMFTHGSLAHIAGNMLYLWVFGNNVEDRLGRVRFFVFYFACGFAAAFAHILTAPGSHVPIVGASGAISGVLGAYYVLFPRARVLTLVPFLFFIPYEVSAGFLLGMWFLMQLLYGVLGMGLSQPDGGGGGGIAFLAHVGGFVAGWLLIRVMAPRRERRDPSEAWFRS